MLVKNEFFWLFPGEDVPPKMAIRARLLVDGVAQVEFPEKKGYNIAKIQLKTLEVNISKDCKQNLLF